MAARQIQIPLRLPEDVVQRVDAHLDKMRRREPGVQFTRIDAVRSLVVRGLDAAERKKDRA